MHLDSEEKATISDDMSRVARKEQVGCAIFVVTGYMTLRPILLSLHGPNVVGRSVELGSIEE